MTPRHGGAPSVAAGGARDGTRGGSSVPPDGPAAEALRKAREAAGGGPEVVARPVGVTYGPVLRPLADVLPEAVRWLWPGRVPLGALTFLDGRPAQGKSTVALDLAARVTTGAAMPDGTPGLSGAALYLSREDDPATTLRPRAEAAGADLARLYLLDGRRKVRPDGEPDAATEPISMADADVLADAVRQTGAVLVVIDPVQSYLGTGVDAHRAEEVRPVLDGLGMMARETGCAVLILRHLRKSSADAAIDRGWGSMDFGAAARSVLLAGADPQEPSRRAIVAVKHSLAAEPDAIGYALVPSVVYADPRTPIDTVRVTWTGACDLTAAAILAPEPTPDREDTAAGRADDWLRAALAGGRKATWDALTRDARSAGHREITLRRARKALGCRRDYVGRGECVWSLPAADDDPAPHAIDDEQTSKSPSSPTAARAARFAHSAENEQTSEAMSPKGCDPKTRFAHGVSHGVAGPDAQTSGTPDPTAKVLPFWAPDGWEPV